MDKDKLKKYLNNRYQGCKSFLQEVIFPIFGEDNFEDNFETELLDAQSETRQLAEQTGIKSIKNVGEIPIGVDLLLVFDITVSNRVMMEHNRVNIQRVIRRVMESFSSAFMIFHYEYDTRWDWRFSYCHKGANDKETSDNKRYTFLLGPGQSCRTAADNFLKLAEKHEDISVTDIEKAFDVEALSKEFFGKYKEHYERFVEYITGKRFIKEKGKCIEKKEHEPHAQMYADFGSDDKCVRDYVKKLLGRIVFLHFLQKKGWMGVPAEKPWGEGDQEFMFKLFDKATESQKENFLDEVLEPLFSEALDTNRTDNNDLFDTRTLGILKVPYLNGGLFVRDKLDEVKTRFPKEYFADLFNFFYQYNFTIDENDPNDAQVGVDPEMLGRIFENLLEDNKDKGAFYTPKEIVQYMCRESLISYLQTDEKKRDYDTIANFVRTHIAEGVEDSLILRLDAKLKNVKICDPAIGSGAFPMGLLRELFFCRGVIEDFENAAEIKKHIIQNNIYGVDIERGAVDIARLRFWLSLVVDEKTPHSLPNLDFKIMQGNSLLESYKGVDLSTLTYPKHRAELNLFDSETDKERKSLSFIINQYYDCASHIKKQEIMDKIKSNVNKQIELQNYSVDLSVLDIAANDQFFLWHTWFSDVFNRPSECGFDIVIGNPPYVEAKKLKYIANTLKRYYDTYSGTADLSIYFIELGYNILKPLGILSYITTNKFFNTGYGKRVRELISKNEIDKILNFEQVEVFEDILVSSVVMESRKNAPKDNNIFIYEKFYKLKAKQFKESFIEKQSKFGNYHQNVLNGNEWSFSNANGLILKEKIENGSKRLVDIEGVNIYRGVTTGYNPAFIISDSQKDKLVAEDSKNEDVIKNMLQGRNIRKWFYNNSDENLIFTRRGFEIEKYKSIKDYLMRFKIYLTPKDNSDDEFGRKPGNYKWYEILDNTAYYKEFEKQEKIIWGLTADKWAFTIDTEQHYLPSNGYILTSEIIPVKYILGLINSKLMQHYFSYIGIMTAGGAYTLKAATISSLPFKTIEDKSEVIAIVDKILKAKAGDHSADISNLETKLNLSVYAIYGLSETDIAIIEE